MHRFAGNRSLPENLRWSPVLAASSENSEIASFGSAQFLPATSALSNPKSTKGFRKWNRFSFGAEYYDAGKPEWLVSHANSKAPVTFCPPSATRPCRFPGYGWTEWIRTRRDWLTAQLGSATLGKMPLDVEAFEKPCLLPPEALGAKKQYGHRRERRVQDIPSRDGMARLGAGGRVSPSGAEPEELEITDDSCKDGKKVDFVTAFWELFDLDEVPVMKDLVRLVEEEKLGLPTHEAFSGGKLLAFLAPPLAAFWEENLSPDELELLRSVIPKTRILDPVAVPPGAPDGPLHKARHRDWMELAKASKKERAS